MQPKSEIDGKHSSHQSGPIGKRAGIVGPPSAPYRISPGLGAYFAKKDSAPKMYFAYISLSSSSNDVILVCLENYH